MSAFREFAKASEDWNADLGAEAAALVRAGHPPVEALDMARRNVARRRQEAAKKQPTPIGEILGDALQRMGTSLGRGRNRG